MRVIRVGKDVYVLCTDRSDPEHQTQDNECGCRAPKAGLIHGVASSAGRPQAASRWQLTLSSLCNSQTNPGPDSSHDFHSSEEAVGGEDDRYRLIPLADRSPLLIIW